MIQNAQIIGDNAERLAQICKRGHPAYIMSRSELKEFQQNPRAWLDGWEKYAAKVFAATGVRPERKSTDSTEWGDAIDCLVLTPDRFAERYAVTPATYSSVGMECPHCPPDSKTKITDAKTCKEHGCDRVKVEIQKPWDRGAIICKRWEEDFAVGKIALKPHESTAYLIAAELLLEDPYAGPLIKSSRKQVLITAEYHDRATGLIIPLQMLLDAVPPANSIVDVKTGRNSPNWSREVWQWYLCEQAFLYLTCWNQATGEERTDFIHIVQRADAPHSVRKTLLASAFLEVGKYRLLNALAEYCQCLKTDVWREYPAGAQIVNGLELIEPEQWMIEAAMKTTPTISEPSTPPESDDIIP